MKCKCCKKKTVFEFDCKCLQKFCLNCLNNHSCTFDHNTSKTEYLKKTLVDARYVKVDKI